MDRTFVEMRFQVQGDRLPVDHGYGLYGAISRILPWVHDSDAVAIAPIRGRFVGGGELLLVPSSRITIRTPVELLPKLLALAGKSIEVDGARLRVGVPTTHALIPASVLYAHFVTTKNGSDESRFDAEIRRQLDALEIGGKIERGPRKTVGIHGKQVVGYTVLLSELTAEESIRVQEVGLGGRRKMGCGVFSPHRG
jgi:CRISPR-associated protein Cas6